MKIAMNLILLSALCSSAISAGPAGTAAAQLGDIAAVSVPAPVPAAAEAAARPVQNWADAAKAAYEKSQDDGGLTVYADLKELPPGARYRLEQELKSLPQGPGNSSEAFKMMVGGRTAFVVQSYINSDSLRVYIFNAAGVGAAYGEGSADTQFKWLPVPAAAVPSRLGSTFLQANITQNAAGREATADDWSSRIRASVRETVKNSYSAELRAGSDVEWPEITRTADGRFSISDWNLNLTMTPSLNNCQISGYVTDENGRNSMVNMSMYAGADPSSWTVNGFGTNFGVSRDFISGYYDPGQYSPKAIAGVLSLIMAHRVSQF